MQIERDAHRLSYCYRLATSGSGNKAPGFDCLHRLFIEPISQDFIHPDSGDISCFVHHKTQSDFSLKFWLASFFGKIRWRRGYAFGSCNTVLMVVVNLVVRNALTGRRSSGLACSAASAPRKKMRPITASASSRDMSGVSRWISIDRDLLKRARTGLPSFFSSANATRGPCSRRVSEERFSFST
jgi:hypothetical protein